MAVCEMYCLQGKCMWNPEVNGKWGKTKFRCVDDDDDDDNSIQFLIH